MFTQKRMGGRMRKQKCIVVIAVFVGLFFPARVCLASEPGTVIQLSMGMVILGGAIFFRGGSFTLKKIMNRKKRKKEHSNDRAGK